MRAPASNTLIRDLLQLNGLLRIFLSSSLLGSSQLVHPQVKVSTSGALLNGVKLERLQQDVVKVLNLKSLSAVREQVTGLGWPPHTDLTALTQHETWKADCLSAWKVAPNSAKAHAPSKK